MLIKHDYFVAKIKSILIRTYFFMVFLSVPFAYFYLKIRFFKENRLKKGGDVKNLTFSKLNLVFIMENVE